MCSDVFVLCGCFFSFLTVENPGALVFDLDINLCYTCSNTPKRVTSLRDPSLCHRTRATQLRLKKCRSGGEPLATLCSIWLVLDLNF